MISSRDLIEIWSSTFSNSATLRTVISFAHVGGLVSGGGCAVAADLGMLRAAGAGSTAVASELERLRGVHRIVVASLSAVVVSGFLLMLANFDAYVASAAFWIKMTLVAALLVNGAVVIRTGRRSLNDATVLHLRVIALASLLLWSATTFIGSMLANVV